MQLGRIIGLALAAALALTGCTPGKSSAPLEVPPIVLDGQEYPAVPAQATVGVLAGRSPTGGYIDVGQISVDPSPAEGGVYKWYAFTEATVARTTGNGFEVPLVVDGTSYIIDAAVACAEANRQGLNFKQSWRTFNLKPDSKAIVQVLTRDDTCSQTMPG